MAIKNKLVKAFTLAEVLITLGIVGIVAEMTIPDLVHNFQEKVLVSQLKETYSILNQTYTNTKMDNGDPMSWTVASYTDIANYFIPYLQTDSSIPYTITEKDLRKNNIWGFTPHIKLKNGTVLSINAQSSIASGVTCTGLGGMCFTIIADVNGTKLPNRHGVDIFTFEVYQTRLVARGARNSWSYDGSKCNPAADTGVAGWWNGSSCGAWVLQNENMDYLKCIDEGDASYCHVYKY